MTRRAAVYERISQDATGEGLGVARQDADCRALVERNGWQLVEVFVDNDVSAFSGRQRPAYQAMLTAIEAGLVDVVVAWHPDRLHRSPRELEDFIDLMERTTTTVVTCTAGDIDLTTPDGRLTARIVGSVARKESEDKSRRLRRKHLELAEGGRPNGGRAFGYEPDGLTVRTSEAAMITEACHRVLDGESLYAIVNDWTAREIPTVRGAKWSTTALRTVLTSERIVGLRTHHGQVVADAQWPAIVDRPTWESVRAVLSQRSRRRERPARAYLLTGGLAVCGACSAQAALVAAPRPYGRAYACLTAHGGCNGVSIVADPLEQLVLNRLRIAVDDGLLERVRDSAHPGTDLTDRIVVEEDKLLAYARMLDAGDIELAEWKAMRDGARARLDELHRQMERVSQPRILGDVEADTWSATWEGWAFEQKRAALRVLVDQVVVASAGRAGGRFDPRRVRVAWTA